MEGKNLQDPNTLKGCESFQVCIKHLVIVMTIFANGSPGALECLEKELAPNSLLVGASPQYRKSLAIGLFYKVKDPYSLA